MADKMYDIAILGAGPGGYVAAIRASQLDLSVAVIEKESPGGVCLNWGCIPSKALISQAKLFSGIGHLEKLGVKVDIEGLDYSRVHARSRDAADKLSKGVKFLLDKNKVTLVMGKGEIKDKNTILVDGKTPVSAKNILIATGSRPRVIPGFEFDEKNVLSSTGALDMKALPKRICILGAGAIGIEFAYILNSFGVEVHVVEMMSHILPVEDEEIAAVLARSFKKRKINIYTETKALGYKKSSDGLTVELETPKGKKELVVDTILSAVGRVPNTEGIGLENVGIKTDRGYIVPGDYGQTSVPGIYAIGDVTPSPLLAHVASKEGEIAVEHIAGHKTIPRIDPSVIPGATYCEPQVASFGINEQKAKEQGLSYEAAQFPFRAIGKAVAIDEVVGMVKVIVDKETREILGAHIVGAEATELIHELLLGKVSELLPEELATMIHAHPTLSESVMEATRASEGWAIHI
jgi:dihydrolipoamide dehydrogenase